MSERIRELYKAADTFYWEVGTEDFEYQGYVVDFSQPEYGILNLVLEEANKIAFGMESTIAFQGTNKMRDRQKVWNTQTAKVNVTPPEEPVAVDEADESLPTAYALEKNFPNPFNPSTTIQYSIPADAAGHVELVIYNMTGQKVRTLVSGAQEAGYYNIVWNGADDAGEVVASGIYLYKLVSGNFSKIEKMTFIK